MRNLYVNLLSLITALVSMHAFGQNTFNEPEILYYKFDQTGTTVQNHASPGGSGPGTINGSLAQSGIGQFGTALEGTGGSGSTNYIATNYATNLTGDWTISFWLDMNDPSGTRYLFGDQNASSFRCFAGGAAPNNGIVVRGGGWSDLDIPNILGTGVVVHVVYTAATGLSEAYVDGVLVNSVTQPANNNLSGTSFGVGSYGNSSSSVLDGAMDEFRLYNRALDAGEISATYNQELPLTIVCDIISNPTFSNVTASSFDFSWDHGAGNDSFEMEYGVAGFTQGTGNTFTGTVSGASNTETATTLSPNTLYHVYVSETCNNGNDNYSLGPITVRTLCGVETTPFYEGFNNATQPTCWDNLSSDPSTSVNNFWRFDDQGDYAAANNGKNAGEFAKVDGNSPYTDSVMLITPEIDITQLTTPYLSFEWFSNNTDNPGDNVPLIVEIYDGSSWNYLDTLKGDSPNWEFVNYDLNAFANDTIQVRFMVNKTVTSSYSYYNDILLDEVRIADCINQGGQDGSLDICRFEDTVNLNDNIIVKPSGGGNWSFPGNPTYITEDSIFNVTYLPSGTYEVYYVERYACYDTTVATINVFGASSAGIGGVDTVCMNQPLDLLGALGGNADMGGTWYDFTNDPLPNSQPNAQNIPGQYNYTYIVGNGVCPADTSIVTISVSDTCDYLSLGEELFTDISVHPNPASSQLNIVNSSNASALKVEMLDMNGRIVLVESKALNNVSEATLDIGHLEKGVYSLRVYNDEGQKVFKIVKQ